MANLPSTSSSSAAAAAAAAAADASGFKLFGKVIIQPDAHRGGEESASPPQPPALAVPPPPPPLQPSVPVAVQAEAAGAGEPLPCPRCGSRETKFCYFNNYNVRQPRHLCRSCRRYWTAGGALRRVASASPGRRRPRPHAGAAAARSSAAAPPAPASTSGSEGAESVDSRS